MMGPGQNRAQRLRAIEVALTEIRAQMLSVGYTVRQGIVPIPVEQLGTWQERLRRIVSVTGQLAQEEEASR